MQSNVKFSLKYKEAHRPTGEHPDPDARATLRFKKKIICWHAQYHAEV